MEDDNKPKIPINIGQLLNEGVEFQIDADDDRNENYFMDDNNEIADEDDDDSYQSLLSPWNRDFDELRLEMEQISEFLYKRVTKKGIGEPVTGTSRVTIEYNAFLQNDVKPFDSTALHNTPYRFILGSGEVLPGLDHAVRTMSVSEEAQFLISYKQLFGDFGCPPRIKPKADGLFVVKLVSSTPVGEADGQMNLASREPRSYAAIKEKVTQIRSIAKDYFQHSQFSKAIQKYTEAVEALHTCNLKNDEEQSEVEAILVALYTSLVVCYNRKEQPKSACRMINEVRRITDINKHAKLLYHEGKALHKLGEYGRSKKSLLQAQKLLPDDVNIQEALKALHVSAEKHRKMEKETWSRALASMVASKKEESDSKDQRQFTEGLKKSIEMFLEDEKCSVMPLPDCLSEQEISVMQKLADEFELKFTLKDDTNIKQYLLKKQ